MEFPGALNRWLATQLPPDLERLLDVVQTQDNYYDHSDVAATAVPLLEAGGYAEARDELLSWMPGMFLSPSTHSLLARAYTGLGDAEAAQREESFAVLSMRSILGSGQGSRLQPWSVLRINDEYDVLAAYRRKVISQATVADDGQVLDQLETEDGRHWWFALRNNGHRIRSEAP